MAITMSDLLADLRIALRSPVGTGSKFTEAELYYCIRKTIDDIANLVWVEGITTLTIASRVIDYTLPVNVDRIQSVQQVSLAPTLFFPSAVPYQRYIEGWEHDKLPRSNTLRFHTLPAQGASIEVRYLYRLQTPPIPQTLSVTMDTTTTEIDVPDSSIFPVPGYVRIESEVIFYENREDSVQKLTAAVRGLFGTAAVGHTAAANLVDPVVLSAAGQVAESVILKGAQLQAHAIRLNDSANSDVPRVLTNYNLIKEEYQKLKGILAGGLPHSSAPNTNPRRPRVRRFVI